MYTSLRDVLLKRAEEHPDQVAVNWVRYATLIAFFIFISFPFFSVLTSRLSRMID